MDLRLLPRLCGWTALIAGLLVLCGWAFGVTALKSLVPGLPAAQPLSGLLMCLCGLALAMLGAGREGVRRAAALPAMIVIGLCLLAVLAYFGLDTGVERWLFPKRLMDQPHVYRHQGRMPEVATVCFLLIGLAMTAKAGRRMASSAVASATLALLVAAIVLVSFLFHTAPLYDVLVAGFSAVSLLTASVLAVLALGVLAAEPLAAWPRRLTLDTPGGALSRVLLPWAILLPIGFGYAALVATREGYFSPDFRLATVCTLTAAAVAAIVIWAGGRIDVFDAARQRFRLLYKAQPTPHLVLAPDFTIEEVSEALLQVTATRREQLIGKDLFMAFPENPAAPTPASVENLRASIGRVLATGAPDRIPVQKYDIRRPSGEFEVRWWSFLNVPVFDPNGDVRSVMLQVDDVTAVMLERDAAARARAGEAHLRAVADAIPGLVFETDRQARNTYVNDQFRAYTGLPVEALLDHGWRSAFHPDDIDLAIAAWREAVKTGRPFVSECRIRRADGAWRWFKLRISMLRDPDGRVEKGIGVCTDVDDARRVEAELREREEQFRGLANSLPQLAWMARPDGWIYWYNQRWYDYTGTTLDEVQGWGWRKVHDPEHVDRVVASIQHAWATGEPWEDTFPLRGADGRYRWFLSRAVPVTDAEGAVRRWFGTNTDITKQRETAELQRTLLQEVSHRVKNSLALVSSVLNLQSRTLEGAARQNLEDAASRVHAVARVHDQLWRAAGTNDIDLGSFLHDLCTAIGSTAPRHTTVCGADPAIVSADMAVPIGLFINELMTNAYKYAYPEGAEGEVRLSGALEPDGCYRLEVSDLGRGLPSGFDLAQARDSLGMRVITSLATQLGGQLTARSANPGARFTLVFPLKGR